MFVGVVESMNHVKQSVTVRCIAVTSVEDDATNSALRARNAAATTASITGVTRNVLSLANLVTKNASGSASITHARNCVESCATDHDVIYHVQSYFRAGILVSVSVGKYARRSAERVTSWRSRRYFSAPRANRTQDSWSWQTAVTCLKFK